MTIYLIVYTIRYVLYEWDQAKAEGNLRKHGVAFAIAENFAWEEAVIILDDRHAYGEERRLAIAPIQGRLHVLVYTKRGKNVRIIGLRKANARERKSYEKASEDK